jgi:hypothetical protein
VHHRVEIAFSHLVEGVGSRSHQSRSEQEVKQQQALPSGR